MSGFDHIILFSLLFSLFAGVAFTDSQKLKNNYWKYLIIVIIAYTIIIGLRYGWGNDYLSYKFRMEHYWEDEDPFYGKINGLLVSLGFNYVGIYVLYAFLFIVSGLVMLRSFPNNKYMIALFLPATLILATNTIRQGFATSFVFIAIYFLHERKYWLAAPFLTFAVAIHTGVLVTISVLGICFAFSRIIDRPFSYKIVIPLYILTSFSSAVLSAKFADTFSDSFAFLANFGKFESYSDNSEYWFGEEGLNEQYVQGFGALVLSTAYDAAIIFLSGVGLKIRKDKNVVYMFNTAVIGFFIYRIGLLLEIINRIGLSLSSFYFIPAGYALYLIFSGNKISIAKSGRMRLHLIMANRRLQQIRSGGREMLISHSKRNRVRLFFKDESRLPTRKQEVLKHSPLLSSYFHYSVNIAVAIVVLYLMLYYGRFILLSPEHKFVWNV